MGHELEPLTPRERDVVRLLCSGVTSYTDLTEALGVSKNTVHYHLEQIRQKMRGTDRAQIVAYAWTHDSSTLPNSTGGAAQPQLDAQIWLCLLSTHACGSSACSRASAWSP